MKTKLKNYYKILSSKDFTKEKDYISKAVVSIVLFIASLFMLIININNGSDLMAKCSLILVLGFLLSFITAIIFKNSKISGFLITLLVGLILSIFAISGGNDGFAILWILLVPVFAINLLGIKNGLLISTYFLIFIFLIFVTPIKSNMVDKYTTEFIARFPILFLADYLISTFLALQKEFYYRIAYQKSYVDELTKVYNRRYFIEKILEKDYKNQDNFGIIIIDINELKITNDTKGHKAGDDLIEAVPICFNKVFNDNIKICRIGGDEFAALIDEKNIDVDVKLKEVKKLAAEYKKNEINGLSYAAGYASKKKYTTSTIKDLFSKADELMYKDKEKYYNKTKHDRRKYSK